MDTFSLNQSTHSTAFLRALTDETLRQRVPSVFATAAHESRSRSYTFISTARVVEALGLAGFYPVDARQAMRAKSAEHARHVIRFRRRFETVSLRDAVPEILFLNSHDGTTAYQLRVGLYRAVCTNGLVVSEGTFPAFRVAHRGDVVADVVRAALEVSERFVNLAQSVERLERTHLDPLDRLDFATEALRLRFAEGASSGVDPARLLVPRRADDVGNDLWRTFNVVQENVIRGGIRRHLANGRLTRTRGITAIKADVRLNSGLWELALARAA